MTTTPFPFAEDPDIDRLVERFSARELPLAEWTHEAHLATALWYLRRYSPEEAICWLRGGIIAYNISQGGLNTPERGYHETLTLFWAGLVWHFLRESGTERPAPVLLKELIQSGKAERNAPLAYYSRERLFSVRARALWVEPDLKPLEWHKNTFGHEL